MTSRGDRKAAKALAGNIVLAQGSIFVRGLLRGKRSGDPNVHIGVTKEEILENLLEAIDGGSLTYADIQDWIGSVEGWGRQHVYLYRCSRAVAQSPSFQSPSKLRQTLKRKNLHQYWDSDAQPEFPDELTLGSIAFDGDCLQIAWHQRFEQWRRTPDFDHDPEVIDGDLVEFRAYRQLLKRSLLRFVVYPRKRKAALFVQIPLSDPRHEQARQMAQDTGGRLFDWSELTLVSISKCIKSLDQKDLDETTTETHHGRVQSQNTRFGAGGATVEFEADSTVGTWKQIEPVRRVRRALQADAFTGRSGKFLADLRSGIGMNRTVTMSLDGDSKRIYLWSQMTASEVWLILDQLLKHSR